ncbi:hypothetical protein BJ508DRAFT_313278 [Ascobolus immersus RN42]|uniref:Uncharacterized protein n=1 Tax=Ascobolus immersus RN42 TaxID=1160509 RepID=A0A3N4HPR4_ASCIM|nr:hypothetical protein BJ508DRAFT_313278 [Ascobolus immersus RN42]
MEYDPVETEPMSGRKPSEAFTSLRILLFKDAMMRQCSTESPPKSTMLEAPKINPNLSSLTTSDAYASASSDRGSAFIILNLHSSQNLCKTQVSSLWNQCELIVEDFRVLSAVCMEENRENVDLEISFCVALLYCSDIQRKSADIERMYLGVHRANLSMSVSQLDGSQPHDSDLKLLIRLTNASNPIRSQLTCTLATRERIQELVHRFIRPWWSLSFWCRFEFGWK